MKPTVLSLAVAIVIGVVGCATDDAQTGEAARIGRGVERQLTDAGVDVTTTSCDRAESAWICKGTTAHGSDVAVRVTKQGEDTYYETLHGLIAGVTLEARLTADYSRRLKASVAVECPKIVEANRGDIVQCTVDPADAPARVLDLKILNDSTGDYRVIDAKLK